MSRIDYSKWDHIDCSSSEDEDNDDNANGEQQPRVTRLDTPSRITRTSDGTLVVEPTGSSNQLAPAPAEPPASSSAALATSQVLQPNNIHNKWTLQGGTVTTETGDVLYWSQDRTTVTLRLTLPDASIKGNQMQVQVPGILPYRDRQAAVGQDLTVQLTVTLQQENNNRSSNMPPEVVLLQGTFPHWVHATEDDELDWSLDRTTSAAGKCYFVMTVCKAVPMPGVVIWWRRPLTLFPEIAVDTASGSSNNESQPFQQAWDEAHRQFRDKMQHKKEQHQLESS